MPRPRVDDPRLIALATLSLIGLAAWFALGSAMSSMHHGGMGPMAAPPLSGPLIASTAGMWLLMMFAMMLPAMAPMLAAYCDVAQRDAGGVPWWVAAIAFSAGYFAVWSTFALAAAGLQLGLRNTEWFLSGGTVAAPWTAACLLIVAGIYQWLPMKDACLRHCRSPIAFLLAHWRSGGPAGFLLGARHGVYCVGCCIALMGLMFVFGIMALWGMIAIAAYCVAERVLPAPELWSRAVGAMLIAAGVAVSARQLV